MNSVFRLLLLVGYPRLRDEYHPISCVERDGGTAGFDVQHHDIRAIAGIESVDDTSAFISGCLASNCRTQWSARFGLEMRFYALLKYT